MDMPRNIPLGIPPWVGTGLPKGRGWKISVCSCCSWGQPRGRGAAVQELRQGSVCSLCLVGSKILVN